MLRAFILLAAFLAMPFAPPHLHASNCATEEYTHNGSLMEMTTCDSGAANMAYASPRPGLVPHGVRQGTLFFEGRWISDDALTGQARIFNARCGAATYPVTGRRKGNTIVVSGQAPIRNSSCRVSRYQDDVLVFTKVEGSADCPPGTQWLEGRCIASTPAPAPSGGDWYAIAGSFRSRAEAHARAGQLGHPWSVLNTAQCPNMTPGYWVTAAGGFSRSQAQGYANGAKHYGAYAKSCH